MLGYKKLLLVIRNNLLFLHYYNIHEMEINIYVVITSVYYKRDKRKAKSVDKFFK